MKKDKLSEICRKFQYPIYPRLSIYNGRRVEDCDFRGYVNNYTRGDDEIFRISDSLFSSQKFDLIENLRDYILKLSELSYNSTIRLTSNSLLRIEDLIDVNRKLVNRRGLTSGLSMADFSFNFSGDISFDELRRICQKGESNSGRRTISPTPSLGGGDGDYRF